MRLAPAVALVVFFAFSVRAGLPANAALRALTLIGLTQVLPGALVWRLVRTRTGWWWEDLVAGLGVGAALAVGAQTLAGSLQVPALAWAPGAITAGAILAVPSLRQRALQAGSTAMPWWWGPGVAATTGPLLIEVQSLYRQVPVIWESGFRAVPTDVYFHLALTAQVAHRGPGNVPFVAGEPLSYHWFSHAWVAQIATTASVPLDQILFRVGPPLLALALVFAIAITAVRVTNRPWTGPVAALIAVSTRDLNIYGGSSPFTSGRLLTSGALSLGFASLLLVVLTGLLIARWRGHHMPGSWILVLVLGVGVAGGKGSALPLLVAGTALALAAALLGRWPSRLRIASDLGLLLVAFLGTFLTIFGGSARTVVNPTTALSEAGISAFLLAPIEDPAPLLVMGAAGLVLVSVLARAAGLLALSTDENLRRDPAAVALLGASLAGALAVVVLSVGGKSQYYFLRNAIPLMALGSVWGFAAFWERLRPMASRYLAIGGAAGVVSAIVINQVFARVVEASTGLGPTTLARLAAVAGVLACGLLAATLIAPQRDRWSAGVMTVAVFLVVATLVPTLHAQLTSSLPPSPPPLPPTERFAFSADQIDAARWLRDHSDVDDVVMTNRHCASPTWVNCDSRRFPITAFTERRVLLEGWAYTRSWVLSPDPLGKGDVYRPFWDQAMQSRNDTFLDDPSRRLGEVLYERDDVRWIFIDKTVEWSKDLSDFATPAYETDWALVLELVPPPG